MQLDMSFPAILYNQIGHTMSIPHFSFYPFYCAMAPLHLNVIQCGYWLLRILTFLSNSPNYQF